jgi:hypothetical protein
MRERVVLTLKTIKRQTHRLHVMTICSQNPDLFIYFIIFPSQKSFRAVKKVIHEFTSFMNANAARGAVQKERLAIFVWGLTPPP